MAHYPDLDPFNSAWSTLGEAGTQSDDLQAPAAVAKLESSLTELAARFVSQSGGGLSPEASADLALEIVLNEIVEQACLTTRATGAAIVLKRGGEMVCRASSGDTAPELGWRFDGAKGLSGLCVETSHAQRCDDAQADVRADTDACRRLGVRSVMVLPLLRGAEVVGLFEVFSPRPSAFGDRDEHTLEALSRRALENLDLAAKPLSDLVEVPGIAYSFPNYSESHSESSHELRLPAFEPSFVEDRGGGTSEPPARRSFDFVTVALSAAVLSCAILLAVMIGQRLARHNSGRSEVISQAAKSASGDALGTPSQKGHQIGPQTSGDDAAPKVAEDRTNLISLPVASNGDGPVPATSSGREAGLQQGKSRARRSHESPGSEGGLRVYENGKEIFRMSPNAGEGELPANTAGAGVQRASTIEPARILELSPAAAEGSLLHRVEPEYPPEARQQQIQGPVVLDVRISRDGSVENVTIVSGQPLLADAAIEAVKQWRFDPRAVNGQPKEMQTTVTLNFRLPPAPNL